VEKLSMPCKRLTASPENTPISLAKLLTIMLRRDVAVACLLWLKMRRMTARGQHDFLKAIVGTSLPRVIRVIEQLQVHQN
jgi:hypothetical protein